MLTFEKKDQDSVNLSPSQLMNPLLSELNGRSHIPKEVTFSLMRNFVKACYVYDIPQTFFGTPPVLVEGHSFVLEVSDGVCPGGASANKD